MDWNSFQDWLRKPGDYKYGAKVPQLGAKKDDKMTFLLGDSLRVEWKTLLTRKSVERAPSHPHPLTNFSSSSLRRHHHLKHQQQQQHQIPSAAYLPNQQQVS